MHVTNVTIMQKFARRGAAGRMDGPDELTKLRELVESLQDQVQELRSKADAAESHLAICNLQAAYGYYVDKGLWDQARWRAFILIAWPGGEARLGEAVYENGYRLVDGAWRIARQHAFITFHCEFDRGPNHGGVPMVRKIEGLQPDRPSTHDYEAFPEVFVPPFHYANPVSGQPWQGRDDRPLSGETLILAAGGRRL